MKLIFAIVFFFFSVRITFAQAKSKPVPTGVYMSYNDYVQHKLKPMDDYNNFWSDTLGNATITFEKAGKRHTFDCSKIWGFQYQYKLFRCGQDGNPPVRIIGAGKIIYYENGLAHLDMIKNDTENGSYSMGAYCYISVNLLGKIVPMPANMKSEAYAEVEKFKKANKQYKKLFACIESDYNDTKVRDCVKKFEKEK